MGVGQIVRRGARAHLAPPILRFSGVGLIGVGVNSAVLWLLTERLHLHYLLSSALATETAILSNFVLNHCWTFASWRDDESVAAKLVKFNAIALGGLAITVGVLFLLTTLFGVHYMLGNLLAIAVAALWNYKANRTWTWPLIRPAAAVQLPLQLTTADGGRLGTRRLAAGGDWVGSSGWARRSGWRGLGVALLAAVTCYLGARLLPPLDPLSVAVLLLSLAIFAQSLFSLYLMLYTWEQPELLEASAGPRSWLPPHYSFTVLLPARHEEAVIYETVKRVVGARYPASLLEIVVICHESDSGTIAEARRAAERFRTHAIRVETFGGSPINKPRGLNVGLRRTGHEIVTVFDAEDDIDPDIFNLVNTVMLRERVGVVQAGVQLMNYADSWFAVHNVLEYFFWFKSRLHFHARLGVIPLGGNTVFIRRRLLERIGAWDEHCLTEDADLGLRLSAAGERIRVVYAPRQVTREETPPDVGSFIRQRTRWQQGFLQVLQKGVWRDFPSFGQRLMALYTLAAPFFQALVSLSWPPALAAVLWLKLPVVVAVASLLPLYTLVFQYLLSVVGLYAFTREYQLRFPLLMPLAMAMTFLPYQWLLGISAVRAVYRQLRQRSDWEKTTHLGAHRRGPVALPLQTVGGYAPADGQPRARLRDTA